MFSDQQATDDQRVYDSAADDYVAVVGTELSDKTEDAVSRAVLCAFIELATSKDHHRTIADLGCGPGPVAAALAPAGLDNIGIDVYPRLTRLARDAHPSIPFAAGQISAVSLADQSLGGCVLWYSISSHAWVITARRCTA